MPITYESPAPIAAVGSVYENAARIQAQRQQALAAAASSGGGYGHQQPIPYDTGIQAAIAGRDQLAFARGVQVDSRSVSDRDVFQAGAARQQQAERFQLESQLSQMQLTQQENMRLTRMKNAIGDVQNDPSLSTEEKADMTMQLRTGIDPLARRQAQAKLAMDQQLKEQQAEQFKFHAATEKARLDALGKSPADRTGFVPDPVHLVAIAEDISANADLPNMLPQERDALVSQMAIQEAMRQGLGTHVLTHADGKETILRGPGSPGHDEAAKSGGKVGGADHPSGLSPLDYLKAREQAESQAHKEQQLTSTNDGTKTNVHPQTIEWKNERTRQIMQAMGLPMDMNEYNKQRTTAQPKGYDPSKAAWNKGKMQPGPTPSPSSSSSGMAPIPMGSLDAEVDKVSSSDLAPDEKMAAAAILKRSRELLSKYPTPADQAKHPEVISELNGLADNYDALRKKMKPAGMAGGVLQKPAAKRFGGSLSQSTTQSVPTDPRGGDAALPPGMRWVRQPDGSLKAEQDSSSILDRIDRLPKPSESIGPAIKWWKRNIETR